MIPQLPFRSMQNPSYDDAFDSRADVYWQQWGRQAYRCRFALAYLQAVAEGEFLTMKQQRKQTQNYGVDFVTIELDDKQEKAFNAWVGEATPKLAELTQELVSSGHKLGVSWDGDNECFIVSVTCKDLAQDNANLCYTSRSDEWVEALLLAIYKWDVVSQRGTWKAKTQRKNWG